MCESIPEWLPAVFDLASRGGDWNDYLEELYRLFKRDFAIDPPSFGGRSVRLKRYPILQGKESTFWHLISTGDVESERVPDLRRCERMVWVKPVISHAATNQVLVWRNVRGREHRILLWLRSADYLVVLADRGDYLLPWTAYPVDRNHTRRKLEREYKEYVDSEKN